MVLLLASLPLMVQDVWQPAASTSIGGVFGERLKLCPAKRGQPIRGRGEPSEMIGKLLASLDLYRKTGKPEHFNLARDGWERLRIAHIYVTGGPWTVKDQLGNPEQFDPSNPVEVCSTVAWIELSLSLFRLAGEARIAAEAERAVLNHLLAAQGPDGLAWQGDSPANGPVRTFRPSPACCVSNGPRGLELWAGHLVGTSGETVSVNSLLPSETQVNPNLKVRVSGEFPFDDGAAIELYLPRPTRFPVEFRPPDGITNLKIHIAGAVQPLKLTPMGFYRLDREWRPGDRIDLHFSQPIFSRRGFGTAALRWMAFTRGPLVLSSGHVLDLIAPDQQQSPGNLQPFFLAGREGGHYQTYFTMMLR